MISPSDSQVAARAAECVRLHSGCIQSNVIEHIMCGRSYGWARRRVHWAIDTGLIVARAGREPALPVSSGSWRAGGGP